MTGLEAGISFSRVIVITITAVGRVGLSDLALLSLAVLSEMER